jgi:O-methyltransferase
MNKTLYKLIKKSCFKIQSNLANPEYVEIYSKYKDFTMIPFTSYCDNLHLVELYSKGVYGDVVECGVWRGGMIAGIAELFGDTRSYHLFDSFEGLPEAKEIDGKDAIIWQRNPSGSYYYNNCTAEIDYADQAMRLSKVTKYTLHKGWFNETLPKFKNDSLIAILRLDADWYDSTMDCLKHLFPRLNINGLIIIDDYHAWEGCSKAVHDYLSSIKSRSRIYTSAEGVCYIIKKDEL